MKREENPFPFDNTITEEALNKHGISLSDFNRGAFYYLSGTTFHKDDCIITHIFAFSEEDAIQRYQDRHPNTTFTAHKYKNQPTLAKEIEDETL